MTSWLFCDNFVFVLITSCVHAVSLRFWRASDGKVHTVNLANANVSDGRRHSLVLRLGDLQRASMRAELYVDCRLADAMEGVPRLAPLPWEADAVEIRHGQKAYARAQVRLATPLSGSAWIFMRPCDQSFLSVIWSCPSSYRGSFFVVSLFHGFLNRTNLNLYCG